jgi:hypothetical protein
MSVSYKRRYEDNPFQLWADLDCRLLNQRKLIDPIEIATDAAKRQTAQQFQGIIPLSECEEIE